MRFIKALVAVMMLVLSLQPQLVSAHAELAKSTPADGAVLNAVPATVVAVFSEELKTDGPTLMVFNAQGQQVDAGDGHVDLTDLDHKTTVVSLTSGLGAGTYTVKWKAITADDNGVTEGSFTFVVRAPTAQAAPAPSANQAKSSPATGAVAAAPLPATGRSDALAWLLALAGLILVSVGTILRRRMASR